MDNRVFLSYAREDEDFARRIYESLQARKVEVWFDRVSLKPGRWRQQIIKAITQSRFFVICLSRLALAKLGDKPGFQDTELTTAFQIALDQSEDRFTIVPVRLEDVDRGDARLSTFQQYDLFRDYEETLGKLAESLGGLRTPHAQAVPKPAPDPDTELARAIYGKAKLFYATRKLDKALTLLQSVEELIGRSVGTLNDRASTLHAAGRYEEALNVVDQAIKMDESIPLVWDNRGKILLKCGNIEEAHASFKRALLLDADDKEALFEMSRILFELDRCDEALEMIGKLVSLDPVNARAYAVQGLILDQLRRDDEALRAFLKAAELDPSITVAHGTIGMILVRSHRCKEALASLDKAIALGSREAPVYSARGVALLDAGRLDEAEQSFDGALQINPNHKQALRCKNVLIPQLRQQRTRPGAG